MFAVRLASWGEAWTVLTNMTVSLTSLLRREERTLREVREKCYHDPLPAAKKLGWKKRVDGLGKRRDRVLC